MPNTTAILPTGAGRCITRTCGDSAAIASNGGAAAGDGAQSSVMCCGLHSQRARGIARAHSAFSAKQSQWECADQTKSVRFFLITTESGQAAVVKLSVYEIHCGTIVT